MSLIHPFFLWLLYFFPFNKIVLNFIIFILLTMFGVLLFLVFRKCFIAGFYVYFLKRNHFRYEIWKMVLNFPIKNLFSFILFLQNFVIVVQKKALFVLCIENKVYWFINEQFVSILLMFVITPASPVSPMWSGWWYWSTQSVSYFQCLQMFIFYCCCYCCIWTSTTWGNRNKIIILYQVDYE